MLSLFLCSVLNNSYTLKEITEEEIYEDIYNFSYGEAIKNGDILTSRFLDENDFLKIEYNDNDNSYIYENENYDYIEDVLEKILTKKEYFKVF